MACDEPLADSTKKMYWLQPPKRTAGVMIAQGILVKKNVHSEIIQLVTVKYPEYIYAYLQTLLVGTQHKVGHKAVAETWP